jgi:hypothetical protein
LRADLALFSWIFLRNLGRVEKMSQDDINFCKNHYVIIVK